MRLAWFGPDAATPYARPLTALAPTGPDAVAVELYDATTAYTFVGKHARHPFDLCVYELADAAAYAYVQAYLFHYPGIVIVHEFADAHEAIIAAKMVLIAGPADALQQDYPSTRVRRLPIGVPEVMPTAIPPRDEVRFAALTPGLECLVENAMARAREAGVPARLWRGDGQTERPDALMRGADVVIALRWPAAGITLAEAMMAMSAGKPVIVYDTESTADWPALDPHNWRPRAFDPQRPPIVVSIDPRDEEHSLMLAIRRLSGDGGLRDALGSAARAWWRQHATLEAAASAWQPILAEALSVEAPRPENLRPELTYDGTARAREILAPFAVTVDFLDS